MPLKFPQRAFSLVELVVVIGIIGLIASIAIASITSIQKNSRDAQRQADIRKIQGALQQFYADNSFYPNTLNLSGGAPLNNCTGSTGTPVCTTSKTYLPSTPTDPVSGTANPYCYTSQTSSNNTASCDSQNPGTCHYFELCAKLENPGGTPAVCVCDAGSNFKVTPL